MYRVQGANRIFTFLLPALLLFPGLLLETTGRGKDPLMFPHFFSKSPSDDDQFLLRFSKGQMKFGKGGVSFQLIQTGPEMDGTSQSNALINLKNLISETIRMEFEYSNPCKPVGIESLASHSNYFLGNNTDEWKRDLQNFNAILYPELYDHIDLKYYLVNNEVKYDFIVMPGGDLKNIKMRYNGIESLTVDTKGTLCIKTKLTILKDYMPRSYQLIDGKEIPVKVSYVLGDRNTVSFVAEEFNPNYPLVIDPALVYSTFVGGSGDDFEYTGGISLDASGNIYVTGRTLSSNFPVTPGVVQGAAGGNYDAFVFKLNPTGTALIFSTFVGGNNVDAGYTTKIDPVTNDVYVGGTTYSVNFPTTPGAYQTTYGGGITDPFSFKLNASGNAFIYSTLLGNAQDDYGASIDIDNLGNVYVVGQTSGPYPTTVGAYQSIFGGGPWDVFVTKLNPSGSAIIFSTLLGGPGEDHSHSIKVDANYDIFLEGMANAGFPTIAGSYDVTYNGGQWDIWVAKMNSTGTGLFYSSYVGGFGADWTWNSLEIDNLGNAYCTGYVQNGFPTTAGAYQTVYGGGSFDVGVFKMNPSGSALVYSTYIGGPGDDQGWGIDLGPNNEAFITGLCSFGYPYTSCAYDTVFNGVEDAFITELNSTGSAVLYSTYIGGTAYDQGYNIIHSGNTVFVAGATSSSDWPYSIGAYDSTHNGGKDIVVFQMDFSSTIPVIADFNANGSVCQFGSIQFNNTSLNASSYYWDFDDGGTSTLMDPLHTFNDTGWHDIMLIVSAPCALADTHLFPVYIAPPAVANFTLDISCGLTSSFTDSSSGATVYSWNFGDGGTSSQNSPSHTYVTDGTYLVTLIVTNTAGCSDTMQQQVTVNPLPAAAFNLSAASCGLSVTFQNSSSNASAWQWNFGDGSVSSAADPTHVYPDSGTYLIMLIAEPGSCADTAYQSATLHLPPVAAFTGTGGCNLSFDFFNTTAGAVSYSWDFGDGSASASVSPSHTYAQDGNYTVTLIAENIHTCRDTIIQQIQVDPDPVADFTFTPPACSMLVSFQNTSQNAAFYAWDFGDGFTSTDLHTNHLYASSGNFQVTLISTYGSCSDTTVQQVTIYEAPVGAFNGQPDCDLVYHLSNYSVNGSSYLWNFGDGNTSTDPEPSHSFQNAGSYLITLEVTDAQGCVDSTDQLITIYNNPIALFSSVPIPCVTEIPFQNMSSNAITYQWYFGDGNTSSDPSPIHTYAGSGTYTVTLIVDPGGCTDSIQQQITVSQPPVAAFSETGNCTFYVQFANESDSANYYSWNFGDGYYSSNASPLHGFSAAGTFDVTLIAMKLDGCGDTITQPVDVVVHAPAAFTSAYDTCLMMTQFISAAQHAGTYYWSFGDGSSAVSANPMHQYPSEGHYTLVMVTNPATQCADTLAEDFEVSPPPKHGFYIPNCFTPNGDGLNDNFNVLDFGDCHVYHLTIFNRWGEVIFETDDLGKSWDGRYKGSVVQEDVYAYILEGEDIRRLGSVLVLK